MSASELAIRLFKIVAPIIMIVIACILISKDRKKAQAERRDYGLSIGAATDFRTPTASERELIKEELLPRKGKGLIVANIIFLGLEVLFGGALITHDNAKIFQLIGFGGLLLAIVMIHIAIVWSMTVINRDIRNGNYQVAETTILEKKIVHHKNSRSYVVIVNEPDNFEGRYALPYGIFNAVNEGDRALIVKHANEDRINSKKTNGQKARNRNLVVLK